MDNAEADRRVEIAQALRQAVYSVEDHARKPRIECETDCGTCKMVSQVMYGDERHLCNRISATNGCRANKMLADLIDPTCKMPNVSTWDDEVEFECSACGCSFAFDADDYKVAPYNYCPNCGARVIG